MEKPKADVIESDGIHLSRERVAILASNIKQEIDQICNVRRRPFAGPQGGSREIINHNRVRTFNSGYGSTFNRRYRNNYQQGQGYN